MPHPAAFSFPVSGSFPRRRRADQGGFPSGPAGHGRYRAWSSRRPTGVEGKHVSVSAWLFVFVRCFAVCAGKKARFQGDEEEWRRSKISIKTPSATEDILSTQTIAWCVSCPG